MVNSDHCMFVFCSRLEKKAKISKFFSEFKFKDYLNYERSYFQAIRNSLLQGYLAQLHQLIVLDAYYKWMFVSPLLLSFLWVGPHTKHISPMMPL